MTPAKLPQRTCIACRSNNGKRDLVRIARKTDGGVEIDLTGKKPGRGAYICPRIECWQDAIKRGRLETALRTTLGREDRLELAEFSSGLADATVV